MLNQCEGKVIPGARSRVALVRQQGLNAELVSPEERHCSTEKGV